MRQQGYWQVKGQKSEPAAPPQLASHRNREPTWPKGYAGCRKIQRTPTAPVRRWGLFNRCM